MIKLSYYLIPVIMLAGCKTQTTTLGTSEKTNMEQLDDLSSCPETGECSIKLHRDSELRVEVDDIGERYPVIVKGDNLVIEYTYHEEGPAGTADGNYSETIHFEVPSNIKRLTKEGASLADVALLFGKHCFCPGEAGYYPITEGGLTVEKTGETLTFRLNVKQEQTSQKISRIVQTVSLR